MDLSIDRGQICGLLGPNGAGKTTLVSIIAGLRRADAGEVSVTGRLGLVPQDIGVYPTLTVRENLVFHGELHGLRRRALHDRIEEVAAAIALTHLLGRLGHELSAGEKRRLHTAMALLHRPEVILLDEPTAAAHVQTRPALLSLVRDLAADGAAICYSTHYLHEIEALGAGVVIIDRGRVVAAGTVAELLSDSSPTVVEMTLHDGTVVSVEADQPAAALATLGADAARLRSLEIVAPPHRSASSSAKPLPTCSSELHSRRSCSRSALHCSTSTSKVPLPASPSSSSRSRASSSRSAWPSQRSCVAGRP